MPAPKDREKVLQDIKDTYGSVAALVKKWGYTTNVTVYAHLDKHNLREELNKHRKPIMDMTYDKLMEVLNGKDEHLSITVAKMMLDRYPQLMIKTEEDIDQFNPTETMLKIDERTRLND